MVRQCQVCGRVSSTYPELSFHRFPVNPERRNIWLSLTGIACHRLPKHPEICSNHFHSSDLIMKANGLRYVKRGANPMPFDYEDSMSNSSDSIYGSPPRTSNILITEFVTSPTNSCEDGVKKEEQDICEVEDVKIFDAELINIADPPRVKEEEQDICEDVRAFNIASIDITDPSRVKKEEQDICEAEDVKIFDIASIDIASRVKKEVEDICQVESKICDTESISVVCPSRLEKEEDICEVEDVKLFDTASVSIVGPSRKRARIEDSCNGEFSIPKKRRKKNARTKEIVSVKKKRVCSPQMIIKRLRLRITSLQSLLKYLRQKSLISESSEFAITASLSGPAVDVFNRLLEGPSSQKYDPSLKSFALTLSFYSAKAYNFVRKVFNRTLPHLRTISKWYRSVGGSPGFTKEAIVALTLKQKESSEPLLCNLVMGEMPITRQVEWTGSKLIGYVDMGTDIDGDTLPEATEALVFMVVCLNGSWKLPIAYFLLNGLSASTRAGLVKRCLEFIHDSGVIITSLTFNGTLVNISMMEELGADFTKPRNLKTTFKHPVTGSDVYIFFDTHHMLKFVRNCMASQTNIRDVNNEEVKWNYVEGLCVVTEKKVRVDTKTISKGVSNAITFLRNDLKFLEFKDSKATSQFLLKFNNLYDIFNSKNRFVKYYYKKPFSIKTAWHFLEFLNEMKEYILTLTLNGTPIIRSSRKTGFLGFLICIESLQKMYEDFVLEKKLLKHILTYKLSQDHLVQFFDMIRGTEGYNYDPTAAQFEAVYKKLVVRSQTSAFNIDNAVDITITCGSSSLTTTETGDDLEEAEEYLSFFDEIQIDIYESYNSSAAWDLTIYMEDVVEYIARFVVEILKKCVNCPKCLDILESETTSSFLPVRKAYDGVYNSNKLVTKICRAADKAFRFFHKTNNIFSKNIKNLNEILIHNTMRCMPLCVYDSFGDHLYDDNPLEGHSTLLVKLILKYYFKIRIYLETVKNLAVLKRNRLRNIVTKLN